jgi:hypothetical protein
VYSPAQATAFVPLGRPVLKSPGPGQCGRDCRYLASDISCQLASVGAFVSSNRAVGPIILLYCVSGRERGIVWLLQPYYCRHSVITSSLLIAIPSLGITDESLDRLQGPMLRIWTASLAYGLWASAGLMGIIISR